jgi:trimeric autotransporter adhesin
MNIFNVYDVCNACKGRSLQTFLRWAAALALCVWLTPSAFAQTFVSGAITGSTTWRAADGPFVVSANVSIQNNAVLTVEAGTRIYMAAGTSVTVNAGAINATGTASAPIRVQSDKVRTAQVSAPGDWNQWVFNAGSSTTVLEYVTLQHGKGLSVVASAPTFNYLKINDHQGAAITIDLAASPTGVGNQASGNTLNGVAVPGGDIAGSVSWGLRGIPYVVSEEVVSVGQSPRINSVVPSSVPQGESVDAVITGQRLDGLSSLTLGGNLSIVARAGATSTTIPVTITAPESAALGGLTARAQVLAGVAELAGAVTVSAKRSLLAVDTLAPASLRRGQTLAFTATGSNLAGATATTTVTGVAASDFVGSANTVNFNLTASAGAPLGFAALEFGSALAVGKVTRMVNVRPVLPVVSTSPALVGLLANAGGTLNLSLSNADDVAHTFTLELANPSLVSVSPAVITISANSTTSATVTLTAGAANGATTLRVSSTDGSLAPVNTTVMVGSLVQSVSPGVMVRGTGPNQLTISGFGLRGATAVRVNTTQNSSTNHASMTVGAVQAATDGTSLTVPITLAADAPMQAMYVTVWQGATSFGVAAANVGRIEVVTLSGEIFAQPAGIDVGGVAGETKTTILATPTGVDVGGVSGETKTTVLATPAGVDVGGVSGETKTTVLATPAGVDVGGVSGETKTQIFAPGVGVDVGPVF